MASILSRPQCVNGQQIAATILCQIITTVYIALLSNCICKIGLLYWLDGGEIS